MLRIFKVEYPYISRDFLFENTNFVAPLECKIINSEAVIDIKYWYSNKSSNVKINYQFFPARQTHKTCKIISFSVREWFFIFKQKKEVFLYVHKTTLFNLLQLLTLFNPSSFIHIYNRVTYRDPLCVWVKLHLIFYSWHLAP